MRSGTASEFHADGPATAKLRGPYWTVLLVFNCLHNLAPIYLSTMCQPVADNAGRRHLRSAACGDLAVPVKWTDCPVDLGKRYTVQ